MATQQQYWQFEIFGTDPDVIGFFGDAGIIIPSGNTAERPASPDVGHFRFNTTLGVFEGYSGSWLPFETGGINTFDALGDTPATKTGSANRVLITNSTETVIEYSANLLLENSGRLRVPSGYEALVDADTVITNKKYTDDQDNLQLFLTGGLMGGIITMGSNAIVGLPLTPSSSTEATSKSYVDGLFAGIDRKESVNLATTTDLDTETGDTWVAAGAKVGKTLTSDANTAMIDGVAVVDGDRILVKNEAGDVDNGIYDVSGVGGGAVVFTRSDDTDGSPVGEVEGGTTTFVIFGTVNGLTQWSVVASGDIDVDVAAMVWTITGAISGLFLPIAGGTMTGTIILGAAGIQISGDTSVATAPAYSFTGDLGTGLHQIGGAGTMSLVIGTAAIWNITPTAILPAATLTQDIGSSGLKLKNVYADHFLPNFGAVGDPSYAFEGATTTGMYNDGVGGIGFAVGGSDALSIEGDGTLSVDTASYETLVLADNDVPNKKYVDDTVAGATSLVDADGDTKVDIEEGADDDTIRMDAGNDGVHGPIADIFVLKAASWTVDMGVATTAVAGAPISISAGDAGGGSFAGGSVNITAGNPATSGDGGSITLTVGAGAGAGSSGAVVIPNSTAPTVTTNKLYSVAGVLTWNGFDLTNTLNQFTTTFDNTDLIAGVLTVTHSLGRRYTHVTVYDNNSIAIQPDTITATSTSVTTIDLTSFGAITGTWNVVVS